jgi:hypothetical protein
MPAALDGAGGKLQRAGCRVGSVDFSLYVNTLTGLKPMAQVECNEFNKKMYRYGPGVSPGFAVYITTGFTRTTDVPFLVQ